MLPAEKGKASLSKMDLVLLADDDESRASMADEFISSGVLISAGTKFASSLLTLLTDVLMRSSSNNKYMM